jgi:hypothetical protein
MGDLYPGYRRVSCRGGETGCRVSNNGKRATLDRLSNKAVAVRRSATKGYK